MGACALAVQLAQLRTPLLISVNDNFSISFFKKIHKQNFQLRF